MSRISERATCDRTRALRLRWPPRPVISLERRLKVHARRAEARDQANQRAGQKRDHQREAQDRNVHSERLGPEAVGQEEIALLEVGEHRQSQKPDREDYPEQTTGSSEDQTLGELSGQEADYELPPAQHARPARADGPRLAPAPALRHWRSATSSMSPTAAIRSTTTGRSGAITLSRKPTSLMAQPLLTSGYLTRQSRGRRCQPRRAPERSRSRSSADRRFPDRPRPARNARNGFRCRSPDPVAAGATDPEYAWIGDKTEVGRQHANDAVWFAIQREVASDQAGVASESRPPQARC